MAFLEENIVEEGKYKDHEGNLYEIVAGAREAVSLKEMVVYKALFKNPVSEYWVISKEEFLGAIFVNGRNVQRFTKVDPTKE